MTDRLSTNQHSAWLQCAMIAPIIQASSNCSWPVVLALSALCLAVWQGMAWFGAGETGGKLTGAIQWLWILPVISEFLHWTMLYWPEYGNYHAVPLVLLFLAAWSAGKGQAASARSGGVMLWFLALLLGSVAVSAAKEIKLTNLAPCWEIRSAHLVNALLIPVMGLGMGRAKRKWWPAIVAVLVSAVTFGVLSGKGIRIMEVPFYEMSRGLTLFGIGQRFESLVAAGMTMGFFVLFTYLVSIAANLWEQGENRKRGAWITAIITAFLFISGMRLNSRLMALGNLLIWVILPILKKLIKKENNA